ncbi:hypothetical protein GDO86_011931 [Hymenochirus boettgeri]|uniref:C2H2-type domain-containing protein n=1 Tax=Hymenochirus boettgeri TaxID=247094 RepID=A0A8T2JDF8_9PIPI|nr:hypothetical protein GDO86_011931 [Hymenochirus boettgeri]
METQQGTTCKSILISLNSDMHQVQESCAGRITTSDEAKVAARTMQCKKNMPNKSQFRTIAPKILPKVVNSYSPSSYPPSVPEITMPAISTKPVVIPTQNYALMKVAGQDGTFSLVALPQVAQPMGTQVMQTTSIPLQENLKLPIPRYQSSRNKKLFDKKSSKGTPLNVLNKSLFEKKAHQVDYSHNSDVMPKVDTNADLKALSSTAGIPVPEEANVGSNVVTPGISQVREVKNINMNKVALPYIKHSVPNTLCSSSPVKVCTDEMPGSIEKGMLRYKNTKPPDSGNPLTVLSQVVFGSPIHVIPSVPKGKLPILPYPKTKKSVVSKSTPSKEMSTVITNSYKEPPNLEISSIEAPNHISSVICSSVPVDPCLSGMEPDAGKLMKPSGVSGKRRGRKRKVSSEVMSYQTKMKLVGSKLVFCKDKLKVHVLDTRDKEAASSRKYRSIMPKPAMDVQSLASLGSTSAPQTLTTYGGNKNKHQIKQTRKKPREIMVLKLIGDNKSLSLPAKASYKCHICDYTFQFKHHLQDHLNTHSNRRPYHCRLCRKAYVHSGSLSTHMKLHHGESRLKKLMCCEFCAKVFGHIRVYFGHLKEVHRVIISTETLEKKDMNAQDTRKSYLIESEKNFTSEEESIPEPTEEIKLQIKCGRCHVLMPTFSDMKRHLLYEHGDTFQDRLHHGVLEDTVGSQEEVVKNATHYWKLLNERRNLKCNICGEEFMGQAKLKKHFCFSHLNKKNLKNEYTALKDEPEVKSEEDQTFSMSNAEVQLWCGNYLNCILCKQIFQNKEELFNHWQQLHNCEDPFMLWTIFTSLPKKM